MVGKNKQSAIITLVERTSKYVIPLKASLKSKDVLSAITNWNASIDVSKLKSITFDRGKKFAKWREIDKESNLKIYFDDPGSQGQRGLSENINRIVRKYLPKKVGSSKHSQKKLNEIAERFNNVPKKSLGVSYPQGNIRTIYR